jgi:hypothetical protein
MKIFIISWVGQHEKAQHIAEELSKFSQNIYVIFSDANDDFKFISNNFKAIKRPNELYWEDKFKTCIDNADDEGILVIHADCICSDWPLLLEKCVNATDNNPTIGVWAPMINGKYWNIKSSGIFKFNNSNLVASAIVDAIIFYLSPDIIRRMRRVKYGANKFGWGIGGLFCSASHVLNKYVTIDISIEAIHPEGMRGYDTNFAKIQMMNFFNQYSIIEKFSTACLQLMFKAKI